MGAIGGEELARWERMDEEMEGAGGGLEKILVSVRLRPLNEKEIARGENLDWECINDATIMFRNNGLERSMPPTAYTFDRVFRCESTTREVYEDGAKQVVLSVVSGINSTIFAYGQTSSGKTYTMNGITEYTVADIYDYIKRHEERAFVLKFSAIEIYNEAVRDLLAVESAPLRLLDDPERGTTVEKLTEEILEDWKHLQQLLCVCEAQRKIGDTLLNENSSRSHQILRLTVESSAREFLGRDKSSTLVASVNFVDLAGSERASLALSSGTRLKEGCHINRSLLTLGTVIRKLSKGRNGHIPYRDSKLTRILQPSLGGNARTAIICTICSAGSHMEQSRNTLLFASCAKEVMTSAHVNVVMSDKALVKQLQKELAKLESELRYPGTASTTSNLEVLLREKDAQIKRMEKEINEVTQERNLAQSRLEGLLQLVGNDCASRQLEAFKNSKTNLPNECKDIPSASNSSETGYHGASVGSKKIYKSLGSNKHVDRYIDHPERLKKQDVLSPRNSISSSMFCKQTLYHGEEETEQNISEDFEDHCKEVQCIETDEPIRSENIDMRFTAESRNLLSPVQSTPDHGNSESKPEKQMDMGARSSNPAFVTLEQHLQNVRKTLDNLGKPYPTEISPRSLLPDVSSCKSLTLSKSRSCRGNLMGNSSPWQESENVDNTPPDSSHRDYSGRPEMFRRRRLALKYDAEIEIPSRNGSESSEQSVSINSSRTVNTETGRNKDVATIGDFVAELKEMAQIHYEKQFIDGQDSDCSAKDVGLDPILSPMDSPSRWPLQFEKKQEQIIELWHECNVSLVHRTYFFILFKGDPSDSIYMEVEVRRLSFLKRTLRRGNLGKTTADGQNATKIASLKNVRHERAMLYRQMQKRMSPHERECAYTKWGIALDSKRRRLQLAHRLWTETGDMEHVRESASIVAKLIGLLEPGEALKEMFSLSFTPQQSNQRSYSWKRGMSSLK